MTRTLAAFILTIFSVTTSPPALTQAEARIRISLGAAPEEAEETSEREKALAPGRELRERQKLQLAGLVAASPTPSPLASASPSVAETPVPMAAPLPKDYGKVIGQGAGQPPTATPNEAPSPPPSVLPSDSPSPALSPLPNGSPQPNRSLTQAERAMLLSEFKKAQRSELKGIQHRQSVEMTELAASQKARYNEWNEAEKAARRKYFSENTKGADRRAYVQDFSKRRDDFLKLMAQEKTARAAENTARVEALKLDHAGKLKEFQEFLSKGERPPSHLWP